MVCAIGPSWHMVICKALLSLSLSPSLSVSLFYRHGCFIHVCIHFECLVSVLLPFFRSCNHVGFVCVYSSFVICVFKFSLVLCDVFGLSLVVSFCPHVVLSFFLDLLYGCFMLKYVAFESGDPTEASTTH